MEDETTTPELQEYFSKMDRPLPGESLTLDPDTPEPYVSQTQFSVPQEALEDLFTTMTQEENYDRVMQGLMDGGSVMQITRLILFSGFNEGKYNPDLMLLMIEPTAYMIMALAERAGIDYEVMEDDEEEMFGVSVDRLEMADSDELSEETQEVLQRVEEMEEPEVAPMSLMARPPPPNENSLMQRQ